MAKAEQDSAAAIRDAKPCCAARVAMSKAVRLLLPLHILGALHSCTRLMPCDIVKHLQFKLAFIKCTVCYLVTELRSSFVHVCPERNELLP